MKQAKALVVFCLLFFIASFEARAQCTSSLGTTCRGRLYMGDGKYLPYYRTWALKSAPYGSIKRVVINVHGNARNPNNAFSWGVFLTQMAGHLNDTLVIAPHFQTADDNPASDELYWSSGGWKRGDKAKNKSFSSFKAIDEIVEKLHDEYNFYRLTKIVVMGFSAGGQFTQRYAAGGKAQNRFPRFGYKYAVGGPGSYAFLDEYRKIGNYFYIPSTSCKYDDYKYGLRDRNSYMSDTSRSQTRSQYGLRQVAYFVGTADNVVDSQTDMGCEANFQGQNRLDRARNFKSTLDSRFYNNHLYYEAVGVGHSSSVFNNTTGRNFIFE